MESDLRIFAEEHVPGVSSHSATDDIVGPSLYAGDRASVPRTSAHPKTEDSWIPASLRAKLISQLNPKLR